MVNQQGEDGARYEQELNPERVMIVVISGAELGVN